MILRRSSLGGFALVAVLSLVTVLAPTGTRGPVQATHGGMEAMSIDMNTAGNSAAAVASIEQCARINRDGIQNFDEDVLDGLIIDVTAEGIPAYSDNGTPEPGDDSGGIIGYQYKLNYPSLFTVSTPQVTANSAVNILAANNPDVNPADGLADSMFNGSEVLPDEEQSNYNLWTSMLLDTGSEAPESGDGVLDRLTIYADPGIAAGHYLLQLTDNLHAGASGAGSTPHVNGFANIAVGQPCGTLTTSLGYYHPVAPKRILDTRGAPYGPIGVLTAGKVGAGDLAAIAVDVTNTQLSGVPASGVTAVVINTTVTGPTAGSHLTVYPSDVPDPDAANLNFVAGQTVPNLVTVKVGPDGNIKVRNNSGQTDVIMDIQGWYGAKDFPTPNSGSRYNPIPPKRILDTRPAPYGPIPPSATKVGAGTPAAITVDVTDTQGSGVPNSGVTAVVVNVTAVEPTAASHLTIYPSDAVAPNAANLNFVGGQPPVPNLVTVKVGTIDGSGGSVKVRNNSGAVHVIFDIVGWYGTASGDVFNPLPPKRILETRGAPYTTVGVPAAGPMGSGDGAVITVDVTDTVSSGVPAGGLTAVVVNTTVTGPTAPSHLTVFPSDVVAPYPDNANLNFVGGQTVPNLVAVKVGPADGGSVKIRNNSGQTHVIMDVAGYFAPVP